MSTVHSKINTEGAEMKTQWEAYKGALGSVIASNVQIGAYMNAVKEMDRAVANAMSGVKGANKDLLYKWCASKATFSSFVLGNVSLEAYSSQIDAMDMRVEKLSGLKMP
ncbi:uncharacterized protein STEHIDRAFT_110897 [Stereum hirsutum FP-91666 SS1]|uniref:uncharacterized protein n=1 Tax=Stereum hirsutum (strain FP-91666) TaxID=721885 RepID=UPI000440F9C7|nr:uncharacterized protein STEHIDRAFT_110897 [Stereum hirsutum FP-91666 SS1]EIM86372.1 hypothetical protein STEHIDRAFT_110897 [Stereum hirsutum FP-91666 SS1]